MHDIAYEPTHDEVVVNSPLTQAILVFRGGANGEEPPLRVIQGPKTQLLGVGALDKVTVDPETGEIYIPTARHNILVFAYGANGDVEPIRVLGGPDTQGSNGQRKHGHDVLLSGNILSATLLRPGQNDTTKGTRANTKKGTNFLCFLGLLLCLLCTFPDLLEKQSPLEALVRPIADVIEKIPHAV